MTLRLEKPIIVLIFAAATFGILYHPQLPVFINEFNTVDGSIYAARVIDLAMSLIIFGVTAFYLIPSFLDRRRLVPLLAYSAVLIAAVSLAEHQLDRIVLRLYNLPMGPDEISDKMLMFYRRKAYDFPILPVNLVVYTLGFLYGLSRDWIGKTRRESKLLKEKMRSDIDYLRSQINPHFFFNALNNIYAVTQRNRDEEAGRALVKLSGLMRYMTYDSNVTEIGLSREIDHIRNYIEVARLKFSPDDRVDIRFDAGGRHDKAKIVPLLLIPFVENAFKHGLGPKGEGYVHITLAIQGRELDFRIDNPIIEKRETLKKHSGIGLENLRKRLDLHYAGQYHLDISEKSGIFSVRLRIGLRE